ncbi:MAG: hypothetical protein ACRC7N_22065 [Clostridium sp.]
MIKCKNNIDQNQECLPENIADFTQTTVDFIACLPKCNPQISNIISEHCTIDVVSKKLIDSPQGISAEGFTLTGKTLMVIVDIKVKYEYIPLNDGYTVHSFTHVYSTLVPIVISSNFNENYDIATTPFLEDINYSLNCSNCVYTSVTFAMTAEQFIRGC